MQMKKSTSLVSADCDFSLSDVFRKCDKVGVVKLDLSFQGGMSTQKVLKVLLYREGQFLEKYKQDFLEGQPKAYKKLKKRIKNIGYLLYLSQSIFDDSVLSAFFNQFLALYKEEKAALLQSAQSPKYAQLLLDFQFFLMEESPFYLLQNSDMPILFFAQKKLKKENFKMAKKLKKAIS